MAAQAKAEAQGVQARGVVRNGVVAEEIAALCHQINADYLVIGQPQYQSDDNIFTAILHDEFIRRIETQTGARVVLPEE